ncbi:hypothetical protein [Ensifer adhaerens]|uniref:hypothetical protein n=1 Tax=Ensifer adhaerens TaxID=106592 RepID=UPI00098F1556|nr:hypothetical protein [Ensifer adhaerens]
MKHAKECEGRPVIKYANGTFMCIDPFCENAPDVQTDEGGWLCLDCAVYHFGGWTDAATHRRVGDHRRDVEFDSEAEAEAIALLRR